MKLTTLFLIAAIVIPAGAAQVYDSPLNDGDSAGVRPLADNGTPTTLNLYIDGGPNESASADKCTGLGNGDELCAWDVSFRGDGALQIVEFAPAADVVWRLADNTLRANGLDPVEPAAEPQFIGVMTVASTGDGDLALARGLAVYSDLNGDAIDTTLIASTAASADTDGDGIPDDIDNCTLQVNPDQRDTNSDGFGNICDADLNNDNIINVVDLGLLRSVFFTNDADADFNGDDVVNVLDLGILRLQFFGPPGPSASEQ